MKKNIFSIFILVCLLVSCRSKTDQSNILNLGVMSSMDYLPLAVAQREGYFEKEGLNIKLHKFYSANDRDAAFQSGNMDGVIIDFTGAILQKSGGIDLKLTSKCDAPFYIVSSKESGIDSLSQMKGKKVAVSQNTVIDYCMDRALESVGLKDSDVEKVEINKIPLRFEMLQNNKIDATGLPNPFALMAENKGSKIITSNADLGFSITGIIFSTDAIDSKNKLIRKMYSAYNSGVQYLKSHKIEDIKDILKKDFGFTEDIVLNVVLPEYSEAKLCTENELKSVSDWLVGRGLIKGNANFNEITDNQFVK